MLLRTASTPALTCLTILAAEKIGEVERVEDAAAGPFRHEQKQAFTVASRFRKVQSESDLQSVGNHSAAASPAACTAAATISRYDHTGNNPTTPQRSWSRRLTGLRRGSSLPPSIPGSSSEFLDELRQTSLPGLQEFTAGEEEASCSSEKSLELRSLDFEPSASGRQVSHGFRGESYLPKPMSFSESTWDVGLRDSAAPLSVVGIGVGSTGGSSNSGFGGGGSYDSSSDDIDAYYRKMIEENPSNSLLLMNYAKFLQEEKRDLFRAEEFYERAILAAPDDSEVRARYAKLIWELRRDEERAGCYFEQAARASPDDCDVLGAYAAFLWDVEEEHDSPSVLRLKSKS